MKNKFAQTAKKAGAIVVALVLIFLFASCKQEQNSQIPNPVVEVKGSEDFQTLGIVLTAPEGAQSANYSIIAKTTAQIQFTLDGRAYTYRAAKTTDDISGVYETFDAAKSYDLTLGDDAGSLELELDDAVPLPPGARLWRARTGLVFAWPEQEVLLARSTGARPAGDGDQPAGS